jgi:uncharacterized protein YpiB (UPF0302 family)
MPNKFITAKNKTKALMQYVKDYEIRDALTLGIVFRLWSELDVIDKGVFLDDLDFITEEPLLIISCDTSKVPTILTYNGEGYEDTNKIFEIIESLDRYYIYLVFPSRAAPYWYVNICAPNPFIRALPALERMVDDIEEHQDFDLEFAKIYKEALLVLIDGALEAGDKKQFMALSEEWRKIA